jgi:hypothetical protein
MKLGFQFVPFPKEIWTNVLDLSQAEFRLLGWLCSKLQFGVAQVKVADHQVLNGFKDEAGYQYPPVGLSKNSLKAAREALVKRKMVVCEQVDTGGGRGNKSGWVYSLNLSDSDHFIVNQSNSDPKPVRLSPETDQDLTLNQSNIDPLIRKEITTEEPEGSEKTNTSSLFKEGVVVASKEPQIPEWVSPATWADFVEMRKRIRAPLTDAAVKLSIRELTKLRAAGQDPNAVIEQSVMNSWRGLFPVKENGTHGQQQTFEERRQQQARQNIVSGLGYGNSEIPRPRSFAVEDAAERGSRVVLEGAVARLPSGKG